MFSKILLKSIAGAVALLAAHASFAADVDNKLIDSVYGEYAKGVKIQMVRAGVTSNWDTAWFESNGTHLSGYWDASIGGWDGKSYRNVPGDHQKLWDLGFTPVFRFENSNKLGFYAEAGIGVHMLSKLYNNDDDRLSTHFQFGDHAGIGYVFSNMKLSCLG